MGEGVSLGRFLAGLDWQALLFIALIALAVGYLIRLDRDDQITFKLVHFISDRDGVGNSASLAYVVALLVSTWALFYLTTHNKLQEWFFAGYIGVFVGGGVWRASISSKERIAAQSQPQHQTPAPPTQPQPPPTETPPCGE